MNNYENIQPFSCSPTDSLCPLLLLLRYLLKSRVLFLRLFGGLERHRKLAQPDTMENCRTIVSETAKSNKYFKQIKVKLSS